MKWCIFVKCLATCLAHSRYLQGVFVKNTPVGIPVLLHNEKMEERTSNPSWYLLLVEVPFFLVFNCFTVLSWFLPCITMNQPSDQIRSVTQSCPTLCDPMNRISQASRSITNSRSSLRLTSIESVMPSSHLILCRPLLLLPPIPPSIRVFSNESTLRMR